MMPFASSCVTIMEISQLSNSSNQRCIDKPFVPEMTKNEGKVVDFAMRETSECGSVEKHNHPHSCQVSAMLIMAS